MRISWNWLQDLIDNTGLTPDEAADILTSTGLEVESVERFMPVQGMLEGVVVGEVLTCAKHPGADRLHVCMVGIGAGEASQIVCGAPNVAAGQKVLVATVGAVLHPAGGESFTIKRAKIRGVESHGMICAADELGLGADHDGIMVLDPSAPVGMAAASFLGLKDDHVIEIGLTPNRSDAMGHWGVARDLVAALNHRTGAAAKVVLPAVDAYAQDDQARAVAVQVDAQQAAPRYAGATLTGITVGPSPSWLQERLLAIGLKPINNVVDVTNYVQHELGQPLHAFDADKLEGNKIIVRMAQQGERLKTLDGKERNLDAGDLLIADAVNGACLAGVYGGANSGVTEGTTAIFLESAAFDPSTIRRTARRHGLSTDASFRFERGVDPTITVYALKRAALLLKEVAGARISSAITDIGQAPAAKRVALRFAAMKHLGGVDMAADQVVNVLEALDCRVVERDERGVVVEVPPYRVDVAREADLVEEVLRIHGLDKVQLPERLMMPPVRLPELTVDGVRAKVAAHFAARGFREVMNPSLVGGARVLKLKAADPATLIKLKNPLSTELDVMRPNMLFGLLQSAAHNMARQQHDLRLFEWGRIYAVEHGHAVEHDRTALLITGKRWNDNWRSTDRPTQLADMKEELELLLARLGVRTAAHFWAVEDPLLSPALEITVEGRTLGRFGAVPAQVAAAFDVGQPVWYGELHEAAMLELLAGQRTIFRDVPRFPAVRRDLSLLLDRAVPYALLEKLAFQAERKLLRRVELFDVYEGAKLPEGKKSYALTFTLQDQERTLTDDQVEKAMARIRQALEKEAGAELRA